MLITRSKEDTAPPLLHWWPSRHCLFRDNFGDALSAFIVRSMIEASGGNGDALRVVRAVSPHSAATLKSDKMLAIGSILHHASTGDVIWGTGVNGNQLDFPYRFKSLDVRSVRGPLTWEFLKKRGIDAPEIFGDPGLLVRECCPDLNRAENPSRDYIVIPNLNDRDKVRDNPNAISPLKPWREVVSSILDSKFVISSSLHGLVIADAYGIPSRWTQIGGVESEFKFQDYYLGTGRAVPEEAGSIDEALEMGPEPLLHFDTEPVRRAFPAEHFV